MGGVLGVSLLLVANVLGRIVPDPAPERLDPQPAEPRVITEMKAMKNYAGHRLSPWLGHLMVSRQETARPLLTPGEVMQLPPQDAVVMVVRMADLPEHLAVPVRLQNHTALERKATQKAVL